MGALLGVAQRSARMTTADSLATAEARVEAHSASLRKELGVRDHDLDAGAVDNVPHIHAGLDRIIDDAEQIVRGAIIRCRVDGHRSRIHDQALRAKVGARHRSNHHASALCRTVRTAISESLYLP